MAWQRTIPASLAPARMLRLHEVQAITGLPRNTVYYAMDHRGFPKPYKPNSRVALWSEADVLAWLREQLPPAA
jgi:prophage regulatory protein